MKPEINQVVENEQLKVRQLAIKIEITGSATPANKAVMSNLPNVVFVRTEGKVAAADAIEDLSASFATATDSTGVFGVLIDGSELGSNGVLDVLEVRSFVESGTLTMTAPVTHFVSTGGNIAVNMDSSVNLASANLLATLFVTYRIK